MTLDEYRRSRESEALKHTRWFQGQVKRLEREFYIGIEGIISGLAVDKLGRLVFTIENIQAANRIGIAVKAVWRKERGFLGDLLGSMLRVISLNTGYFRSFIPELTDTLEKRIIKKVLLSYGWDDENKSVIPGTWFDRVVPTDAIAKDVAQRINQAIAAKMPLVEFRQKFRSLFINPEGVGYLERYYSMFTNDLYQQFDRAVQLAYKEQLGLKHGLYSGTVMDRTRDFCEQRVNNIYEERVIDSWDKLNWKGKNPYGSVKLSCGGYNCRHHWSWVSEQVAERMAQSRGGMNKYNQLTD